MNGKIDRLCRRIGIFGGTFDPPHIAHRVLAMEACDQLGLEKLLWVLTAAPPHKQDQPITPVAWRVLLVQEAIRDNPLFELSRVEIDRPGPHYAADTLELIASKYPDDALYYLIGGDSLRDLPGWYSPDVLLRNCEALGVMRRPGDQIDIEKLEDSLPGIREKIRFIETPMMEISSTRIREQIQAGRSFRYYLPEGVYRIIEERDFYRVSEYPAPGSPG